MVIFSLSAGRWRSSGSLVGIVKTILLDGIWMA
jgi:hypothetical protein